MSMRRFGRLLAALVAVFVLFSCTIGALAGEEPRLNPQLGVSDEDGAVPDNLPTEWGVGIPGEPTSGPSGGNLIERLVSLPLQGIFWALNKLVGLVPVYELVFVRRPERGVFTSEQWKVIEGFRHPFEVVAWLLLVVSAGVSGVQLALAGPDPRRRSRLTGMLLDVLVAALLIEFMPLFFDAVCDLNGGLVETVRRNVEVADLQKYLDPMKVKTDSAILTPLVQIAWITLTIWFNMIYWVRLFVVGVLYVLSPLLAWSLSMHATKTPFFLGMSEVVSNVFMQGAHAVVLGFWALLIKATPGLVSGGDVFSAWWVHMGAMVILIPVSGLVRNLVCGWMNILGVKEEQIAGAAALGVGGLVGLGTLAQALGGVVVSRLGGPRVSGASVTLPPPGGGNPPGWQPLSGFSPGTPPGGSTGGGGGGGGSGGPPPGGGGSAGPTPVVTAGRVGQGVGGPSRGASARVASAVPGGAGVALAGAAGRTVGSAVSHAAAYPVGSHPAGSPSAEVGEAAAVAAASRLLRRGEGKEGKAEEMPASSSGGVARPVTRASGSAARVVPPAVGLSAGALDGYFHGYVPFSFPQL